MKTVLKFPRHSRETRLSSALHQKYRRLGWNVQIADPDSDEDEARQFISFWHPDGCLVNNDTLPAGLFKGIPTVFTHRDKRTLPPSAALVSYDERGIAEIAAKELLSQHCASYAYIPDGKREYWDRTREKEFANAMRKNFKRIQVFAPPPKANLKSAFQFSLAYWLKDLPRPIGLFPANDLIAEILVSACNHVGLPIPGDAIILSVDNDAMICESTNPTISSICFSSPNAHIVAAKLLDKLMSAPRIITQRRFIRPSGIVYRASTMQLRKPDPEIIAARELIRTKSCEGLKAQDVLKVFSCARRQAEIRFRNATGCSILSEIRKVRQSTATVLLKAGRKTEAVANLCGYASRSSLHRLLKARARTATADSMSCGLQDAAPFV